MNGRTREFGERDGRKDERRRGQRRAEVRTLLAPLALRQPHAVIPGACAGQLHQVEQFPSGSSA